MAAAQHQRSGCKAREHHRFAGHATQVQLLLQVGDFGLALGAGAGTVTLIAAFARHQRYVVGARYLLPDFLQDLACSLTSIHNVLIFVV